MKTVLKAVTTFEEIISFKSFSNPSFSGRHAVNKFVTINCLTRYS